MAKDKSEAIKNKAKNAVFKVDRPSNSNQENKELKSEYNTKL